MGSLSALFCRRNGLESPGRHAGCTAAPSYSCNVATLTDLLPSVIRPAAHHYSATVAQLLSAIDMRADVVGVSDAGHRHRAYPWSFTLIFH